MTPELRQTISEARDAGPPAGEARSAAGVATSTSEWTMRHTARVRLVYTGSLLSFVDDVLRPLVGDRNDALRSAPQTVAPLTLYRIFLAPMPDQQGEVRFRLGIDYRTPDLHREEHNRTAQDGVIHLRTSEPHLAVEGHDFSVYGLALFWLPLEDRLREDGSLYTPPPPEEVWPGPIFWSRFLADPDVKTVLVKTHGFPRTVMASMERWPSALDVFTLKNADPRMTDAAVELELSRDGDRQRVGDDYRWVLMVMAWRDAHR